MEELQLEESFQKALSVTKTSLQSSSETRQAERTETTEIDSEVQRRENARY